MTRTKTTKTIDSGSEGATRGGSVRSGGARGLLQRRPALPVWIAIVVIVVVIAVLSPGLIAPSQWPLLLRQAAPLGLLTLAQTLLLIGRGFDMSVGGVLGIVSVVAAGPFAQGSPVWVLILMCLAIGALVGLANGVLIAGARLSPLIVTLSMSFALTGAMLLYTGGAPTGKVPDGIRMFSSTRLLGLPLSVWVWAGVAVTVSCVLAFTWRGRHAYAIGTSPETARFLGVREVRVQIASYIASGTISAVAGLMLAGFVGIGSLGAGQGLMLNSIAAAVVGGAAMAGGRGNVIGAIGGALLLSLVTAALTSIGIGEGGGLVMQCIVFIAAAALFRRRRA